MRNITNIPAPRVEVIDPRTGLMSREWYRFFINLFNLTGAGGSDIAIPDLLSGPEYQVNTTLETQINDLNSQTTTDGLLAQIAQIQKDLNALKMQVQPQLGTMAALQQANLPWVTFDTTPQGVPTAVGTVAWDGGTTLGIQATANILMRVGEAEFIYVKASSAITKGQLCYHTGSVGASGVITAAPTPLALSDPNQIIGVAAENIALNNFGLIQISGDLRGFNTSGSSVGETWADGDPLYYNPAYVGSFTKVKPTAPNQKTYIGEIINASAGGAGAINIRIVPGSVLGGTDSNVQITSVANNDILQYDTALGYWKNAPSTAVFVGTASAIAAGAADQILYQTGPGATSFITAPSTADTYLKWSGSAFQWAANPSISTPVTKTADFTVGAGETWIINNKSGSTCTVTLPSASANTGRMLSFQNYQAQLLVSASSNVVPLGGGSAGTAILAAVVGNWATMVSDGTNWVITQDAPNNALLTE